MKKLSFQRFSPRALLILGALAGFGTCAWAPAQAAEPVPVTVPIAILDAMLQTSQVGMNMPALSTYTAFVETGRVVTGSAAANFGGWKVGGATINNSAWNTTLSADFLARPAKTHRVDNNMRVGLLGRVDGLYSTVKLQGNPTIHQQTNVLSLGLFARLQVNDPFVVELMGVPARPRDESNTVFTFWGYLNRVTGNTVNNPNFGSPWETWGFSLNASALKTIHLYDNGQPVDEVGHRWELVFKPGLQVGVNKLNLKDFNQINENGQFGGTVSLHTRTHFYFKLNARLDLQGSFTEQVSDEPVRHWNVYLGASYLHVNNPVSLTLPNAGRLFTDAASQQFGVQVGAGITLKSFRVALDLDNSFNPNANYHEHNIRLTAGYQF